MSISIVTHGMIGGVGVGGASVPQGPATIIEGPPAVGLEELIPDALLAQGIAFVPDPTRSSVLITEPDPTGVDSSDYVPTPLSTYSLTPQPIKVEEEG